MTSLFVSFDAMRKNGQTAIGNCVFKEMPPIATYEDVTALEAEIAKFKDYEIVQIRCWQRMETATRSTDEKPHAD